MIQVRVESVVGDQGESGRMDRIRADLLDRRPGREILSVSRLAHSSGEVLFLQLRTLAAEAKVRPVEEVALFHRPDRRYWVEWLDEQKENSRSRALFLEAVRTFSMP